MIASPSLAAPVPPTSSFSLHDTPPTSTSTSNRTRSSSEVTLTTIYSMYGDPALKRRSTPRSSPAPPLDRPVTLVSTSRLSSHITTVSSDPRRESTLSTRSSSELPYAVSSEDHSSAALKPPRPPRSVYPGHEILATSSSLLPTDAYNRSSSAERRSLSKPILDRLSTPSVNQSPSTLSLQKPTPPTPEGSPLDEQGSHEPLLNAASVTPEQPEDPDGYFIRNIYAQLDVTGVPGDGYEDGVERTRARLNADTGLLAANPAKRTLNQEELKLLRNVDRYGFFSATSGERRVSLPRTKPLSNYPLLEMSSSASPDQLPTIPSRPPVFKEKRRIGKWERMIVPIARNADSWKVKPGKERKLRPRVYKGIPDRWRSAAWELLIKQKGATGHREYRDLLDNPSPYDVQIDLDVPRTISGHILFRTRYGQGQRALFHVLHAFSLHCGHCGYCQGMGPLAATFLCYVEPERAHDWMCHLHDTYTMDTVFRPGFPGLLENIFVQEKVMSRFLPGVYAAFKKHLISTTAYATKWYITLFANTLPFQTQLRLWDAFLVDGIDVIVLMAVRVIWNFKEHLLSRSASFETILSLLSSFLVPEDDDELMRWLFKVMNDRQLREDMGSWRTEWRGLVARGEDSSVLL